MLKFWNFLRYVVINFLFLRNSLYCLALYCICDVSEYRVYCFSDTAQRTGLISPCIESLTSWMQLTVNEEDSQTSMRACRSSTWASRPMTPLTLTWVSTLRLQQISFTWLWAEEVRGWRMMDLMIFLFDWYLCCHVMSGFFSGIVLVHCHVGVSRSATLVLAYLMLKQNLTLVDAICAVKENRGVIPNRGFLRQLIKLDSQLFGRHWTLKVLQIQFHWVRARKCEIDSSSIVHYVTHIRCTDSVACILFYLWKKTHFHHIILSWTMFNWHKSKNINICIYSLSMCTCLGNWSFTVLQESNVTDGEYLVVSPDISALKTLCLKLFVCPNTLGLLLSPN